ncbi:hypothetical protein TeGR_g12502, partial [Tetraparma gracilis]
VALGKAKATLDCSATEAFAYQFAVCGREKMRIGWEEGDRARFIFKEHAKHDFEWASVKKMPFPLTNREFLARYLSFKEPAGDLVLVFEALPDSTKVDYGANLKVVRGKITGVVRFKSINDDTQCEVTLVQHGDAGGFVPERVVVAKMPQALSGVAEMRELFQRDDAMDKVERDELAGIIERKPQIYDDQENALMDRVQSKFSGLKDDSLEPLESPDLFVKMRIGHAEGDHDAVLKADVTIDADISQCAAFDLCRMSRKALKEHHDGGGLERSLTRTSEHNSVFRFVRDYHARGSKPREFVGRVLWKRLNESTLVIATESFEDEDQFPLRSEFVRGTTSVLLELKKLDV